MQTFRSEIEVWKPIPGYEGLYEASSQGRIRTAEGKTTSTARFDHRVWQQRIIKQKWQTRRTSGKKDARVTLWKDGEDKTLLVARLVAMSFLSHPYDTLTVNHIDGNTENNCIENLEWVTRAENNSLGFREGLFRSIQKPVALTSTDGHELHFASMSDADRYLHKSKGYTSLRIARAQYLYDDCGVKYWARLDEE